MNTERDFTTNYPGPHAARLGVPAFTGLFRHRESRASGLSSVTPPCGAAVTLPNDNNALTIHQFGIGSTVATMQGP